MWNQITNKHIFIFMIIKRVNNRTRYAHYQKQVWIEVKLFYFRQEDIRQGYWMSQRHAKWSYTYIFDFLNMIFIHSEIDWAKRKGLKFEMLAYQRRFVFFFSKFLIEMIICCMQIKLYNWWSYWLRHPILQPIII